MHGNFQATLLAEIDRFLARHPMTAGQLGERALNDPAAIPRIRRGRSPLLVTADRLLNFMHAHDQEQAAIALATSRAA